MQHPTQPTRADGFSLAELLVVTAIIALITTILLPAVQAIRGQARQVTCAASLRANGSNLTMYALSYRQDLPTYYRHSASTFDTFWLDIGGQRVNLGLLQEFAPDPGLYYCSDQPSESVAYDSPANQWVGNDAPPGPGPGNGAGSGPGPGGPGGGAATAPREGCGQNVCASFAVRPYPPPMPPAPRWSMLHFANRVIYTDFVGVDGYTGGRFTDLRAAHRNQGANRLFGDGSVQWAQIRELEQLRPITDQPPTYEQLHAYFERLDVLP